MDSTVSLSWNNSLSTPYYELVGIEFGCARFYMEWSLAPLKVHLIFQKKKCTQNSILIVLDFVILPTKLTSTPLNWLE
ncbi:unnamed protein product [Lupinus luteus]|uniref:Uncharacterized protein n=1 Tax=Lupinus luteus TaxID=3873 RepID=A0AAV1WD43_LUPLU